MSAIRVEETIAKALRVPIEEIGDDSSPETLAAWDSASHIDIVLSIEAEFGASFSSDEILTLLSVRSIKGALKAKGVQVG
jgi:acyl carrier protein